MERHDLLALMTKLKLAGMRAAYDDIMRDGLKRQRSVQQILGDLLSAEVAEKEARSISYQIGAAKLPLAKELTEFKFTGSPVNEALVRDLHVSVITLFHGLVRPLFDGLSGGWAYHASTRWSLPSCSRPSRTLRAAGAVARRRAILDRRCARRHVARAGRDGRMAAIEQKDGAAAAVGRCRDVGRAGHAALRRHILMDFPLPLPTRCRVGRPIRVKLHGSVLDAMSWSGVIPAANQAFHWR